MPTFGQMGDSVEETNQGKPAGYWPVGARRFTVYTKAHVADPARLIAVSETLPDGTTQHYSYISGLELILAALLEMKYNERIAPDRWQAVDEAAKQLIKACYSL